jgi:hypothetical protein
MPKKPEKPEGQLVGKDPIHFVEKQFSDDDQSNRSPGWYFWDETWTHRHGPYATRAVAEEKIEEYIAQNLEPPR